ncbi:hypothetical protein SAMN04488072_102185 [Lentibacillus halodurans]|uniref:Uncharacterized protein n=1 Tax=Lentibacillus halodurans TaxID=237679 RepID=A0A1I0W3R0_9BACI|nr:hypothetical protein [Lentibacillus halodurans]SFA83241.1 hypothetical protein SAMN04488072_102185 [Lentibacillus halodurans]
MAKPVGFDQKILLHQLDFTLNEARRTKRKEMYEKLDEFLIDDIRGVKSRKNAATMLMKIWYLVNDDNKHLQENAFHLYPDLRNDERLVLHYGMTVLAYPFVKDLVREMGKLFKLQDEVTAQQISRIMKNLYGDRRRVEVATSAVLMSLKSWGVISSGDKRHIYITGENLSIQATEVKKWLAEAIIRSSEGSSITLEELNSNSVFFPFDYTISSSNLDDEYFRINRQGLDMIMVGVV